MRGLNGERMRPSPCSEELTPSNSATRSTTSAATSCIVCDLVGPREVEERADVQAADRAVPVEAGVQPARVEDLLEARDVLVQVLGRHRRVLDERRRPRAALAGGHQQAEPGLAHLGQRVLLGRGLGAQEVVAVPVARATPARAGRACRGPRPRCHRRTRRTAAPPGRLRAGRRGAGTRASPARARGSCGRSSRPPTARARARRAVASIAPSSESKCPTANIFAFGSSTSRTVAPVTIASVPSEPTISLERSNGSRRSSR